MIYYDSARLGGDKYCKAIAQYVEEATSRLCDWEILMSNDGPRQDDNYNCGTFVLMTAYMLTKELPLSELSSSDAKCYRKFIKKSIQEISLCDFTDFRHCDTAHETIQRTQGTKTKNSKLEKELSPYELIRLNNIQRNNEFLETLGLEEIKPLVKVPTTKTKSSKRKRAHDDGENYCGKKRKTSTSNVKCFYCEEFLFNLLVSCRFLGQIVQGMPRQGRMKCFLNNAMCWMSWMIRKINVKGEYMFAILLMKGFLKISMSAVFSLMTTPRKIEL